jgi:tRNA (guanine37-N1)-methyltransferase
MKIDILTIFPEMFNGPLTESLIAKAREKKIVSIDIHDIRSFSEDKHHTVDDRPFGGGPGMVMKVDTLYRALRSVGAAKQRRSAARSLSRPLVIYLSPQGEKLDHAMVVDLSRHKHLVLLCGHYEGVDERAMRWVDREVSIGDYVLTGGELPAMVLTDAVVRQLPGVVKEAASVENDSFFNGLLDYPHYTRPAEFQGMGIPPVLLSGHHGKIEEWRRAQALARTAERRPDLLQRHAAAQRPSAKKRSLSIKPNKHTK